MDQLQDFIKLGELLYKLFNGEKLTEQELIFIASFDEYEKICGLKIYTRERLKLKNDKSIEDFETNIDMLREFERIERSKTK